MHMRESPIQLGHGNRYSRTNGFLHYLKGELILQATFWILRGLQLFFQTEERI